MQSLKVNFLYNSILTISGYLFPLITYPYVSRVLGVTNIGIYNFVDSFVNYFILLSMMGISTIGIREIAGAGNDEHKRNLIFTNLFILNGITTFISLIVYICCILLIPELNQYGSILWLGAIKLVANFFLIGWLFSGLEKFRYITIRSIIVHFIYVVAVLIFVKDDNDCFVYYLLLTISILINAIINCWHSRTFIKFSFDKCNLKQYLKPILILGVRSILTSMYTTFNVVFLGVVASATEVGYYSTATKLYSIIISLFTAFTSVMLPRMSCLIEENRLNEFKNKINQSVELLLLMSVPLIIYAIIFAPEIILFISGDGYEGAIIPMRLVMPLVLIIGLEQIYIIQVLVPLKADKSLLINTLLGALIGILLNFLIVFHYKSIGSSLVWIFSELTVLSSALYFVKKKLNIRLPYKNIVYNILYYIPCLILLYIFSMLELNYMLLIIIGFMITLIYASILNIHIIKNEFVLSFLNKLTSKKMHEK